MPRVSTACLQHRPTAISTGRTPELKAFSAFSGECTGSLCTPRSSMEATRLNIPVKINGKLRSRIIAPADASEDTIVEKALADEKIKAAIAGKKIVKKIVVPSKLVNIVVR